MILFIMIFFAQKTDDLFRFLYVYLFNYSFLMSQSGKLFENNPYFNYF